MRGRGGGGGGSEIQLLVGSGTPFIAKGGPIDYLLGTITFDGSKYSGKDALLQADFQAIVSAGDVYIKVYDVGPDIGPATPAVQITANLPSAYALGVIASGPVHKETAVLTRGGAPGVGTIMDTARRYEIHAYINSTMGDETVIGSAGFKVRA